MSKDDKDRVVRRTYPSVAFTITVSQNEWLEQSAKAKRISKSEFLRDLLKAHMEKKQVAA